MFRLGISEKETLTRLSASGIDFAVTDSALERLQKAGASPGVLDAVKRLAAKKPDAGPERKMMLWTHRHYKSYDNPLACEAASTARKSAPSSPRSSATSRST